MVLVGSSYHSQNCFFRSKNLVSYVTFCALQDGHSFIRIEELRLSSIGRSSRAVTLMLLLPSDVVRNGDTKILLSSIEIMVTCSNMSIIDRVVYHIGDWFYLFLIHSIIGLMCLYDLNSLFDSFLYGFPINFFYTFFL